MKALGPFTVLSFLFFIAACASVQLGGEFASGRQALLKGNQETALTHFQSVAQKDPNYVYGTAMKQGIWSYVGRSDYALGRLPQAREALERALAANREEDIARLYLGLTLARQGDRQRGLKEIEGGLKGIHGWLEYISQAHRFSFGQFWDPGRDIRSAIEGNLAMISGRDADWNRLIADGEWIGKKIEEESDLAGRQESREWSRDTEDSAGFP